MQPIAASCHESKDMFPAFGGAHHTVYFSDCTLHHVVRKLEPYGATKMGGMGHMPQPADTNMNSMYPIAQEPEEQ